MMLNVNVETSVLRFKMTPAMKDFLSSARRYEF